MVYPRLTKDGKLIGQEQLVGCIEHLYQKHRIVAFDGEVAADTNICTQLMAYSSMSSKPIKMIINSNGGFMDTAFLYCDTMKQVSCPVHVLARICCSAAVMMLASGTKGHRYLMPHSKVMLHLPSGAMMGDAKEMAIQQREMEDYKNNMISLLQSCGVKKTKRQILKDIDREFWLNPEQAIEYGLADKIMNKETMKEWLT